MATLVFLCNGDEEYSSEFGPILNNQLPELIKRKISAGEPYKTDWSCWNSRFIKVGDRAYLQRSGSEPSGFIAAGYVVAAPEDQQLRLDTRYSKLDSAYTFDDEGCFYVCIRLDSVVDFDSPLNQKELAKLPQFRGVNFNFGRGGARFNAEAATALDAAWEEHSRIQQRKGKGIRLVDVFVERGDRYKQEKDYQAAISQYREALKVDSNYSLAKNKLASCERELQRNSPPKPGADLGKQSERSAEAATALLSARDELDRENFFASKTTKEAQDKIFVSIARRQGQAKFRQDLLEAYERKCAITNFDAEAALEAAHIIPYIETENNHPSNGLLLRADLHTLFDLNLIAIHPETLEISLHSDLRETEYREIHGRRIRIPRDEAFRPKQPFLEMRFKQCDWF